MKYLLVMLLMGCASVKSVRDEPFIDIDIDGQPRIVHTLESASQVETPDLIGAGDALGISCIYVGSFDKGIAAPVSGSIKGSN